MTDPKALEAFDLSGRVAVVSGACSGMGRASARLLAAAGAHVVLGDVDASGLDDTASALEGADGRILVQPCDVTRSGDVEALVALASKELGRLDVMANLAGVIHDAPVLDTDESDLDRVLAVNLKGVYFGCQSAARVMQGQGSGSIVNMASSGAFTPIPQLSTYAVSKAGVVALTRTLAAELGRHGVRVNAIAPGYVEGGMTARHARRPDGSVDEVRMGEIRERTRRRNPLRILGRPEDVANALLFLASDASRYITGQVIHANGGSFMA